MIIINHPKINWFYIAQLTNFCSKAIICVRDKSLLTGSSFKNYNFETANNYRVIIPGIPCYFRPMLSLTLSVLRKNSTPTVIVPMKAFNKTAVAALVSNIPNIPILVITGKDFNLGRFYNIGHLLSQSDHLIFHRFTPPTITNYEYYFKYPSFGPIDISHSTNTIHGFLSILSCSKQDFVAVNGYPTNTKTGKEQFHIRYRFDCKEINIYAPHYKLESKTLFPVDWNDIFKREKHTSGITTTQYSIKSKKQSGSITHYEII